MRKPLRCRLGFHKWEVVMDTLVHVYSQCILCSKRKISFPHPGEVSFHPSGCYQPVDKQWVETGEWAGQGRLPSKSVKHRR